MTIFFDLVSPNSFSPISKSRYCWLTGMGDRDHHRSYYAVLGLNLDASAGVIRSTYRLLALKWYPDRRQSQPWLQDEANHRFQNIQEAYQVLSGEKKRSMYDASFYQRIFYDRQYEETEGFSDFMEEMMELIATEKKGVLAADVQPKLFFMRNYMQKIKF